MAARVTHPHIEDHWAVIIITIDNEQISTQLKSLDSASGKFALEQMYTAPSGKKHTDVIAASGSATVGSNTRYADVPETSWRVSFSPSDALLSTLSINPGTPCSVCWR